MKPPSTRKRYNNDFKIEAIKLIESEGCSLAEGTIRLGISKSAIFEYIESFNNIMRKHSTLNYCSPTQFEQYSLLRVS
jgi:transposase-like protein